MSKYQNGKIYKIVDVGYNKCYIGSTCESLSQRMARHRARYRCQVQTGKTDTQCLKLFDEFGATNCKIEPIEHFPCNCKEELLRREGEHIRNNDCVNKNVAGRSKKDYKNEYKEYLQLKNKEHYEKNREHYLQMSNENYWNNKEDILTNKRETITCPCGSVVRKHEIRRHERSHKHKDFVASRQQEEN